MTTEQLLLSDWDWNSSVVVGCGLVATAYVVAVRAVKGTVGPEGAASSATDGRRVGAFGAGLLVLLFALVSPLDTLGDRYLFSAHMVQHMLLVLVVPPLLLLGIPVRVWRWMLSWRLIDQVERVAGTPLLGWLTFNATLWIWHAPPLYDAALAHEGIHVIQHLTFLVTATLFWWPVIAPVPERRRLQPLAAMGYLVIAALSSSVLGIILTFAPVAIYPPYVHPVDTLGILPLIRQTWRMTPTSDQEIGGLLMWIPGGLIYLFAIVLVVARWFAEPEVYDMAGAPAHGTVSYELVDDTLGGHAEVVRR